MNGTMNRFWRQLPALVGAHTLAALLVAASTTALLPASAAAQGTAAQRNAVRHYCRADFAERCPGVIPSEALICLEANLDDLSRNCKKSVLSVLGADAESAPVADAAPPPATPRAAKRPAPIVSTKPPRISSDAQAAARRRNVVPAGETPPGPPPADRATRDRPTAAAKAAATAEDPEATRIAEPPESQPPSAAPLPPESEVTAEPAAEPLTPETEQATLPPEEELPPAVARPRRPRNGIASRDPLVQACWRELNTNCRGMRAGGGREFACLARHSRSLSPRCWQAYRSAWARRR